MPPHHFMLQDFLGALRTIAVFPLFVLAPGYLAGWLLNLFAFRNRTLLFRLVFAVPLSISVCPILTYLTGRFASMTFAWAFYALTAAGFLLLLARERRWSGFRGNGIGTLACMVAIWLGICLFSTMDLQIGDRLYFPTSAIDLSLRSSLIHSISTTGLPPGNPFFHPGQPAPLRYHYFWLMMCSLAGQAAGTSVTARQSLIGGTFWAGAGVMALLAVYLRLFRTDAAKPMRRRLFTGFALLAITGLDVIPALIFMALYARGMVTFVLPSVEWWNEHVDWFVYTAIWAPHALASTIACFTAFLLIWHAAAERRYILPASLALASAAGSSVYVAMVFAMFLMIWTAVTFFRNWRRDTLVLCACGAGAFLFLLPYLQDLLGHPAGSASPGAPPLQFTIRDFSLAALIRTPHLSSFWRRMLINGPLLPLNYFLEFGLFFLVARFQWLRHRAEARPLSREDTALAIMAVTSTVACTFLRSSIIGPNDLGWRGFLIAQFALLLWAVDLFGERDLLTFLSPAQKQLMGLFFVIGLAGTAVDLAVVRFYPLLADRGAIPPLDWMSPDREFGRRTYAEREVYEWLQTATEETAVVQANPNVVFQDTAWMSYSDRSALAATTNCLTVFGGDPGQCPAIVGRLERVFPEQGGLTAAGLQEVCGNLPLDAVVVKDTDAVWKDRSSWVWKERSAFANAYIRVYRCGSIRPARPLGSTRTASR